MYFAAEKGRAGGATDTGKGDESKPSTALRHEPWVKDQSDEVRTMLSGWENGLKTALNSERDARRDLEKQVRDLAGKAEKGSQAQTELTQLADQIAEADRKVNFFEAAHLAGATNLKLAYLVAVQDDLFDKKGQVDFETMKKSYPELFTGTVKQPVKANSGEGRSDNQSPAGSMNAFIRKSAGRS